MSVAGVKCGGFWRGSRIDGSLFDDQRRDEADGADARSTRTNYPRCKVVKQQRKLERNRSFAYQAKASVDEVYIQNTGLGYLPSCHENKNALTTTELANSGFNRIQLKCATSARQSQRRMTVLSRLIKVVLTSRNVPVLLGAARGTRGGTWLVIITLSAGLCRWQMSREVPARRRGWLTDDAFRWQWRHRAFRVWERCAEMRP